MHRLSNQRELQPVCHVPARFGVDPDRVLADTTRERHRPLHHVGGRSFAANDLHERHQVSGIERMDDDDTLGVCARLL